MSVLGMQASTLPANGAHLGCSAVKAGMRTLFTKDAWLLLIVSSWLLLIPALLALFVPLRVLLRARIRARDFEGLLHQRMKPVRDLKRQPWLWGDVLRSYFGVWALMGCWHVAERSAWYVRLSPYLVSALVICIALAIQMRARRGAGVVFAPISFCTGILFALVPFKVAVIVLVFALASLVAFRTWWAFFLFGAIGAAGVGYLMLGRSPWLFVCVLTLAIPLIGSWLSGLPLRLPLNRIRVRGAKDALESQVAESDAAADADESEDRA